MDLWAFSLTKEPFHDYQQSVNHQLSFGGTGHSEGGTDATGTNDLDRFSILHFTREFQQGSSVGNRGKEPTSEAQDPPLGFSV